MKKIKEIHETYLIRFLKPSNWVYEHGPSGPVEFDSVESCESYMGRKQDDWRAVKVKITIEEI